MSIYGYDNATGMLEIRNPWGTAAGQTWDTTFEVSLTTLLGAGDKITVDNLGGPQLTSQTAAQTWQRRPGGQSYAGREYFYRPAWRDTEL